MTMSQYFLLSLSNDVKSVRDDEEECLNTNCNWTWKIYRFTDPLIDKKHVFLTLFTPCGWTCIFKISDYVKPNSFTKVTIHFSCALKFCLKAKCPKPAASPMCVPVLNRWKMIFPLVSALHSGRIPILDRLQSNLDGTKCCTNLQCKQWEWLLHLFIYVFF